MLVDILDNFSSKEQGQHLLSIGLNIETSFGYINDELEMITPLAKGTVIPALTISECAVILKSYRTWIKCSGNHHNGIPTNTWYFIDHNCKNIASTTEVKCMAELIIYLIENKKLRVDKINKLS